MDCPFVPCHIKKNIVKHVEFKNVVGTLMDQSHKEFLWSRIDLEAWSWKANWDHRIDRSIYSN